jgi:hypothetical protein
MALIMGAAMLGPFVVWLIWRSPGYKRVLLDRPPGAEWVRTEEAFIDPSSRQVAQVWINPASGERAYVRRQGFTGAQP